MTVQAYQIKTAPATFMLDGEATKGKGKKPKQTPLQVEMPALVNCKPVKAHDVLVFSGSLTLGEGVQLD